MAESEIDSKWEVVWEKDSPCPDTPEGHRLQAALKATKDRADRLRDEFLAAAELVPGITCEEYVYRQKMYESDCQHQFEEKPDGATRVCKGKCRGKWRIKVPGARHGYTGTGQ